jgi:hypothetical protein
MKLYKDDGTRNLDEYSIQERVVHLPGGIWEPILSRFTDTSLILGSDTQDFFVLTLLQNQEPAYIYTGDSEEIFTAFNENKFKIDILGLIADHYDIKQGHFTLVGNFYQRIFKNSVNFLITEINKDRTEIRIELAYTDDEEVNEEYKEWANSGDESKDDIVQETLIAWFNVSYESLVVAWKRDKYGKPESTILKLAHPLSDELAEGDILNIYKQKMLPFVTDINVQRDVEQEEQFNILRQPSFRYNYSELPQAGTVEYKSENLLLQHATGSVTQSIKNALISESRDTIRLNVDYRDYKNFVCFSSATERLNNFQLKLQQIEYYQSQSDFVSTTLTGLSSGASSASVEFLQNKAIYDSKINEIKTGFDGYEKYLFYESHSAGVDRNILDRDEHRTDIDYVSFYNTTWPKTNSSKPYTLAPVNSATGTAWFTRQQATASLYDTNNPHELKELLPDHIKLDENNSDYLLFTDMIGHHFDEIYTYIRHMGKIHNRDESLYDGMSKDLIYDTAKSMGWTLQPGFDLAELWEYVNGTDKSGSYITQNTVESFYDDLLLRVGFENDDGDFTLVDTSKYNRPYWAKTKTQAGAVVYNASVKGVMSKEPGAFGNAAIFAGSSGSGLTYAVNDGLSGHESDKWIGSGSFAVSFWAKWENATFTGTQFLIDATAYGDTDNDGSDEASSGFRILRSSIDPHNLYLYFTDTAGSTTTWATSFTNSELTGSLNHYVFTCNRADNSAQLWFNGELKNTNAAVGSGWDTPFTLNPSGALAWGEHNGINFPGQGVTIGGYSKTDPTSVSPFTGSLDDVRVYGRALTTQSIQDLYTQPERYKGKMSFEAGRETPNLEDVDKQIWKRIVNNLPQILKSKGTKRSIQQFLSCYGIPKTLMNIQEFGGSAPVDGMDFQELTMHNYGIHISESAYIGLGRTKHESDNVVGLSTDAMPQTIQLRFKSYSQSGQLTPQSVIQSSAYWGVLLQPSGTGSYGSLKFYLADSSSDPVVSASVDGLPLFDGDWWNMQLSTNVPVTAGNIDVVYTLRCAKSGDHEDNEITHSGSATLTVNGSGGGLAEDYNDRFNISLGANVYGLGYFAGLFLPSYNSTWAGHFTTGSGWTYSTDAPDMNFSGSLQEYREYAEEISEDVFHRHTMAPTAYFGNHYTSSYDTLTRRFTLGSDGNAYNHHNNTNPINSSHPNQANPASYYYISDTAKSAAEFYNFRNETDADGNYKEQVEEHYISAPNSIGNKRSDRKIRSLNTYSDGYLSPNKTHDSSSLDFVGKDSHIVQVALSPTDNTDLDIAYQFGENRVDDFVGDPRDRYKTTYPILSELRKEYFKKYSTQPNIFEFSKILNYFNRGFFRQLENLLPARAVKRVGLIIKPNSLERSKVQGQPQMLYYSTSPSSQSFDSTGIRQRSEYRENFAFETTVSDTTSSFISGIGRDKLFKVPRDNDYSTADSYRSNVQMSSRGSYGSGKYVSQSFWRTGTTSSIEGFSWMDSRALRSWEGVRDFAATESQLRHRIGRFEKLSAGTLSSYYKGSKLKASSFNEPAATGDARFHSVDGGPIVSYILIKTNQLIVKERSGDGSLRVQ